jgi:hypothetical protein
MITMSIALKNATLDNILINNMTFVMNAQMVVHLVVASVIKN